MALGARIWLGAAAILSLAACSGGNSSSTQSETARETGHASALAPPPTPAEAARFLTHASFGATDADIAAVQQAGFSAWIAQRPTSTPRSPASAGSTAAPA